MTRVVLLGNGLSMTVNDGLRLDALTQQSLDRHGNERQDLTLTRFATASRSRFRIRRRSTCWVDLPWSFQSLASCPFRGTA